MLNSKNQRMLAYIEQIGSIQPISGADRIELARVNAWPIIVRKGEFKPGDMCVFFEIDSRLPEAEWSAFMAEKGYKVKTMKLKKFGVFSQGLALPLSVFNGIDLPTELRADCTQLLGVKYISAEDNERKGSSPMNQYEKMAHRHKNLFKHFPFKQLYKTNWGKKMLYVFLKPPKKEWPAWVEKTNEERIQNMPFLLKNDDDEPWVMTEKIDGTSTTFTYKAKGSDKGFYVCSRNVMLRHNDKKSTKKCFYNENVYEEMAQKYNVENVLRRFAKEHDLAWVTLQGETYGAGVQKRDYTMTGHDFAGFNLIDSNQGRWNTVDAAAAMKEYGIPWVPILDRSVHLLSDIDALVEYATGESVIDGLPREGLVFRSLDGRMSFKVVSNEFLLKYHNGD